MMTEWNEYRNLNLHELKSQMRGNVFIDLRNIYERNVVEEAGFNYSAVGR